MKTFKKIISYLFIWSFASLLVASGGFGGRGDMVTNTIIAYISALVSAGLIWLLYKACMCISEGW